MRRAGIHPVDMIVRIARAFATDDGEMGRLHARFVADHELENFATFDALSAFWSEDGNMERLRGGQYGKLNYVFTYDIVLNHYDDFNDFLARVSHAVVAESGMDDAETLVEQCTEVLAFSRELRVTLTESMDMVESKRRSFNFDLLAWRQSGYHGQPARIATGDRFEYEFYLPDPQRRVLDRQLSQFRSHSINLTLRKMSEEISADNFFYRVRNAGHPRPATDTLE
jgi:hypothetical protein